MGRLGFVQQYLKKHLGQEDLTPEQEEKMQAEIGTEIAETWGKQSGDKDLMAASLVDIQGSLEVQ